MELEKNRPMKVNEDLRCLKSVQFMNNSKENLVASLPEDNFRNLDKQFEDYQTSDIKLLCGKEFYPDSYIDSFDQFKESKLPPLNSWITALLVENNISSITKSEIEKTQKNFGYFDNFNLGDYHDHYLSVDPLPLAGFLKNIVLYDFKHMG